MYVCKPPKTSQLIPQYEFWSRTFYAVPRFVWSVFQFGESNFDKFKIHKRETRQSTHLKKKFQHQPGGWLPVRTFLQLFFIFFFNCLMFHVSSRQGPLYFRPRQDGRTCTAPHPHIPYAHMSVHQVFLISDRDVGVSSLGTLTPHLPLARRRCTTYLESILVWRDGVRNSRCALHLPQRVFTYVSALVRWQWGVCGDEMGGGRRGLPHPHSPARGLRMESVKLHCRRLCVADACCTY